MSARWSLVLVLLVSLSSALPAQGKITLPVSLAELEKRVVADSNDAAAHYNVALGYWNAKRWTDVDKELRNAIALEPRFAQAHLALAYLPFVQRPRFWDDLAKVSGVIPKELQEVINKWSPEYRHAFLIDPMVDLRIIAAAMPGSVSMWDVRDALGDDMALFFQGRVDCYEGNYAECEGKYTRLFDHLRTGGTVGRMPDDLYWLRGLAAAHEKHYDVALGDFKLLMDRETDRVKKVEERGMLRMPMRTNEYRYFSATFQHAAGKTVEAVGTYREAVENDIGLYMAHVRLANIFEADRDYARAIQERRYAANANPDDATLLLDLGVTLGKSGAFPEAATTLRTVTERLPRHTEAWFWLGLAEQQLGRKAEAKTAFERVVALAPSRLKARADQAKQRLAQLQ